LTYDASYEGDRLFRIDPEAAVIADLGVPVPRHGLPSLAGWTDGGLLYGEAPDPRFEPDQGVFFVYDVRRRATIFVDDDPAHVGFRNVAVDAQGRAYYSIEGGVLRLYDPRTGETTELPDLMPGAWLRASTEPAADGTVYAVTTQPDVFFAIDPSGQIRTIAPARSYTASIALDPDGERILYVPGAHGESSLLGTPLVALDPETGEEEELVRLHDAALDALGVNLGGTYDLVVDPSRRIVYIGMNAGPANAGDDTYGEIVLLVVHLP
jgi:dipeptidyl aminopeptidase/acylaminoacyl peptidase